MKISIHALREEGDLSSTILESPRRSFLSTPSARRATAEQLDAEYQAAKFLSTPSARRATLHPVINPQIGFYFYPRPPRGGRLSVLHPAAFTSTFLSTPSARRATALDAESFASLQEISIHALREEGD